MSFLQATSQRGSRTRLFVLLIALIAAGACKGAKSTMSSRSAPPSVPPSVSPSVPVDTDRFPHALHSGDDDPRIAGYNQGKGLVCIDCHPQDAVMRGESARPGQRHHAPCDECHEDEFYKPPGRFCAVCHDSVDLLGAKRVTMQPYPERGFRRVLASRFSHRAHLDAEGMESAMGFHLSCSDCHQRDASSRDPMLPGHAQCARCHSKEGRAHRALSMGSCAGCHETRKVDLTRGRIFITGDLTFAHASHERDASGAGIGCEQCHDDVRSSRSVADTSVPRMMRCAVCHEDGDKTPDRVRIARCEVCHSAIRDGLTPTNHMIGGGVVGHASGSAPPEDHTIEFRTNHGEQAGSPDARCSYCHEGMMSGGRDTCFQCHTVMRPRDHNLGWRTDSHGREAAADRDRCATCHVADECVACHSVPPRSHQPMAEFRLGGHKDAARFDTRSCFACHTYEDTCSNCHREAR